MNTGEAQQPLTSRVPGVPDGSGRSLVLRGDLLAENSLAEPTNVVPLEEAVNVRGGRSSMERRPTP